MSGERVGSNGICQHADVRVRGNRAPSLLAGRR
jgi:hypothetical protein